MRVGPFTITLTYNERFWFGTLFVGGYLGIGAASAFGKLNPEAQSMTHDVLIGLSPLLTLIGNNIFKTDKVERQNADIVANMARSGSTQSDGGTK